MKKAAQQSFNFKIEKVTIRLGSNRPKGVKYKHDHHIYIHHKGESILEEFANRRTRDYTAYRKYVLPEVFEYINRNFDLSNSGIRSIGNVKKWEWAQRCGCTCPCSPGFHGQTNAMPLTITVVISSGE